MSKTLKLKDLKKKTGQLDDQGNNVERSMYEIEETQTRVHKNQVSKADLTRKIAVLEAEKTVIQTEIDSLTAFLDSMVD